MWLDPPNAAGNMEMSPRISWVFFHAVERYKIPFDLMEANLSCKASNSCTFCLKVNYLANIVLGMSVMQPNIIPPQALSIPGACIHI